MKTRRLIAWLWLLNREPAYRQAGRMMNGALHLPDVIRNDAGYTGFVWIIVLPRQFINAVRNIIACV